MRTSVRVAAVITFLLSLAAPQANASHIDSMFKTANLSDDCSDGAFLPCQTDNSTLRWFDEASISSSGRALIDTVLEGTFEPTDFAVSIQDPPSYTGTAETDIIFRRVTLPPGVLGQTFCDDAISATDCDQAYVEVSVSTPTGTVICHEAGHTVGLTHGIDAAPRVSNGDDSLGCMQTPDSEVASATLGMHNTSQINATY